MARQEAVLLAQYAREQDADAFRALIESHQHMVFAACNRILCNRADAEDAAQDCFFQLARKAGELRAPIAGWLHKVAVHAAIDMLRRKRSRLTHESAARELRAAHGDRSWDEIKGLVDEAIAALPERLRVPLVLYYLEGRKQDEIAAGLGVSQPAVSGRLKRGVDMLRKRLKKAGIVASLAALASLLSGNAVEAAPATLSTALGKMALAGVSGGSAATTAVTSAGGLGVLKAAAFGAIAVAAITLAWTVLGKTVRSHSSLEAGPDVKLPTHAATAGATAPDETYPGALSSSGHGVVVERVLNDDGAGRDMFVDFDSGRLLSLPLDVAEIGPMVQWMRRTGADAFYEKSISIRALVGADMAAARVQNECWNSATPDFLVERIGTWSRPAFTTEMRAGGRLPVTYAFRTREGGLGILQIVEFVAQPSRALKIRYKITGPAAPEVPLAWTAAVALDRD